MSHPRHDTTPQDYTWYDHCGVADKVTVETERMETCEQRGKGRGQEARKDNTHLVLQATVLPLSVLTNDSDVDILVSARTTVTQVSTTLGRTVVTGVRSKREECEQRKHEHTYSPITYSFPIIHTGGGRGGERNWTLYGCKVQI